jgi:hypothetical protein
MWFSAPWTSSAPLNPQLCSNFNRESDIPILPKLLLLDMKDQEVVGRRKANWRKDLQRRIDARQEFLALVKSLKSGDVL